MKNYIALLFWLLISVNSHASSSEYAPEYLGTAPLKILENMVQHDCGPIRNYYSSYPVEHPPYVLIRRFSEYAYLCETVKDDITVAYKLVVEGNTFRGCPKVVILPFIIIGHNKPGGLDFTRKVIFDAEHYYHDNGLPEGGDELGRGIDEVLPVLTIFTDEGIISQYICVDNKWYIESGAAE